MYSSLKSARALIRSVEGKALLPQDRSEKAIQLASYLLEATVRETTAKEKRREQWLSKMLEDPKGRAFITSLTDQCFRSSSYQRTIDQILFLLEKYGIPKFLETADRFNFILLALFGRKFPKFSNQLIKKELFKEFSRVLLPEKQEIKNEYLKKRWEEGVRVNINHLGEAILGETEAEKRLNIYLEDLARPEIEYISVKISSIYSQIHLIGWEKSLDVLSKRLSLLFRKAMEHTFITKEGKNIPKFVNLDMEEYRDLDLTVALFQKVLSQPEFYSYTAGIVLQSYLPDSFTIQKKLTEWAIKRVHDGGAPIKIRLVKGANLAMELVDSSLHHWPLPVYAEKALTDANFKRMLEYGADTCRARAVHLGVASHNLFDLAYALVMRAEKKASAFIELEMLQGMAPPMVRVLLKLNIPITLYCPTAKESEIQSAIAYLLRRLDENSGPQNFLRYIFNLTPDSPHWEVQKKYFLHACGLAGMLEIEKKRSQNRSKPIPEYDLESSFTNEPSTDFSLEENRKWASEILSEWREKKCLNIPIVIGGEEIHVENKIKGSDPSRPSFTLYNASLADEALAERALAIAKKTEPEWFSLSYKERSSLLGKAAQKFRERRSVLIGVMVADGGKTILEADPEVDEAIDFIEYYRKNWEKFLSMQDLFFTPKGTILVTPPWNFPCSIPTGGIAAALTAGNCVLFKPAPEAIYVGWEIAKAFWDAGIPKNVLQFIPCPDDPVGSALIQDPRVSAVILTGSTETAKKMKSLRWDLDLHAETGGKNTMIITALADKDLAVKDLVQSAFGHSGQKCSACSLAILEAEVYDNPDFLNHLKDAAQSLSVGSAWDPSTKINPLIAPPSSKLLRGLTQLEEGESWLLEPKSYADNLWSPGIKLGVKPSSFTHLTELFGPILGLMRADNLEHAIELANGTPYGLTAGLHSLDEREHAVWSKKIVAGNLYINRGITGAIVRRQPFGGCKASSFGKGAKAGGPNYVAGLVHIQEITLPIEKKALPEQIVPLISALNASGLSQKEREIWQKSAESYAYWHEILKEPFDPSCILGQNNYFYHIPLEKMFSRFEKKNSMLDLLRVCTACLICKTPLSISTDCPLPHFEGISGIRIMLEREEDFLNNFPEGRIRLLTAPKEVYWNAVLASGATLVSAPILANGRLELLHYMRSISLSVDFHRYGSIVES